MSHLMREQAPLSAEEWRKIDRTVISAARNRLAARRVIPLFGPLGAGMKSVGYSSFGKQAPARISLIGQEASEPVLYSETFCQPLPMIFCDFVLFWRDIEWSKSIGINLDCGAAGDAAIAVAASEDDLIFNGRADMGMEGILNAKGRNSLPLSDWKESGQAFENVINAVSILTEAGYPGPFALLASPQLFSHLHRVYENTGILEINQIASLIGGSVLPTPAIKNKAVLIATGAENIDIVIGQDLITAYLTAENMNHIFRVLQTLSLRIKHPGAICSIE